MSLLLTLRSAFWAILIIGLPLVIAYQMLGLNNWDMSIPWNYSGFDDMWQLALTKFVEDTGWIFGSPYLGAPGVADWHYHAAAQTSAMHPALQLMMSFFIHDAVRLQQLYYLLNFPLICLTSFIACRMLMISRLPALCVGLLFAFTTYRINWLVWSYLSNYFMVPLAIVAVIWIFDGHFDLLLAKGQADERLFARIRRLVQSKDFCFGLLFVTLTATSDGYYAFFTLLLLAFGAGARFFLLGWRRLLFLLPAAVYVLAMTVVAFALQIPLQAYKRAHIDEFIVNGAADPTLIKHPFEAEVYSSTLKLLVAPITNHRLPIMADLGAKLVKTHTDARKFPSGGAVVPLGTLGSVLFGIALFFLAMPGLRRKLITSTPLESTALFASSSSAQHQTSDTLLSLTLIIFLFSIVGGINTLVAMVYPTIRAYERFALFLLFVLFLGAARFATGKLTARSVTRRIVWVLIIISITVLALYDQIPKGAIAGDQSIRTKFLSERLFVKKIETMVPPNSMVYQYPYSQYLSDNKYYGWGSFGHIRYYLHSAKIRWSNGGSRNSPADEWNRRLAELPLDSILNEIEDVGFKAMVIDRAVVKAPEYEKIKAALLIKDYQIIEDGPSKMTFVMLHPKKYVLSYDEKFKALSAIEIFDKVASSQIEFPSAVDDVEIRKIAANAPVGRLIISKKQYPSVYLDDSVAQQGWGNAPILPLKKMRGEMTCTLSDDNLHGFASKYVTLDLTNKNVFDWHFGAGAYPLSIGYQLQDAQGKIYKWDDIYRVPTKNSIQRGKTIPIRVSLSSLPIQNELSKDLHVIAKFKIVQDGNAWLDEISCVLPLK